jgi:hypothetical protein
LRALSVETKKRLMYDATLHSVWVSEADQSSSVQLRASTEKPSAWACNEKVLMTSAAREPALASIPNEGFTMSLSRASPR